MIYEPANVTSNSEAKWTTVVAHNQNPPRREVKPSEMASRIRFVDVGYHREYALGHLGRVEVGLDLDLLV